MVGSPCEFRCLFSLSSARGRHGVERRTDCPADSSTRPTSQRRRHGFGDHSRHEWVGCAPGARLSPVPRGDGFAQASRVQMTIAFVSHSDCGRHDTGWGHPEHVGRLRAITRALRDDQELFEQLVHVAGRHASEDELALAHDVEYIRTLRAGCRTRVVGCGGCGSRLRARCCRHGL
jgi:hypothetical protein